MFDKFGNFADLMKNAGKIRETMEKATEALGQVHIEGTAGGGAVTVKVNGRLEVLTVRIDPQAFADGDRELLEDLIAAATNDALTKAREAAAQSITGSLPIPPGLGGLFGG